jgi:DNA-directed RNA polymerase II subunit RPB2
MTIGQLIECLVGKVAALEGQEIDGTAFSNFDLEDIKARMKALGYDENGYEYMYNGMTGRRIKNMIFIGPTYYQRLKHMVADKIHARARGPQTILTRQPPEGRSRDGGLRFGEIKYIMLSVSGRVQTCSSQLIQNLIKYKSNRINLARFPNCGEFLKVFMTLKL